MTPIQGAHRESLRVGAPWRDSLWGPTRTGVLVTLLALPVASTAQTGRAAWQIGDQPLVAIGSREAAGPGTFGRVVGALRQHDGSILVADRLNRELRLFSSQGELIKTIGRDGAGPGEFRSMLFMRRCAGDSALVFDAVLARVSVFSPSGLYVRGFDPRDLAGGSLPPSDIWCNAQGMMAVVHRSPDAPSRLGPRRPDVDITLVTTDRARTKLGRFPASERYFLGSEDIPRPLGKLTSVGLGGTVAYLGTGDAFELAVFSLQGKRVGTIRDPRPLVPVTSRHIDEHIRERLEGRLIRGRLSKAQLEMVYRDLEYPAVFPAYGRLLVDPEDNVWIEDYPIPGATRRGWSVFSKTGVALARTEVPANFEVLEVGTSYVLGIWRDEFDTDYVRLYSLAR